MNKYMIEALEEAKKAEKIGEIPIGAIIEKDGQIIGRGHNPLDTLKDPTAHAECLAIKDAADHLGGWRLTGCNMYVTIEPCSMCSGAMVWSRINKVYIGAMDPKGGACGSIFNIVQEERLNHFIEIEAGIMEEECRQIVQDFFKRLRKGQDKKSEETK